MKLKLIPNWVEKNLRCWICGTKNSVKYEVKLSANYVGAKNYAGEKVCVCNRCALVHSANFVDQN
jgi:hypothetical protein